MNKFDISKKGSYYKRITNYRNIQSAYPGQTYFLDWCVFNDDSTRANYNNRYILMKRYLEYASTTVRIYLLL